MSLGVCLVLVATLTVASGLLVVVETGILHIRRSRAEVLVERLVDREDLDGDPGRAGVLPTLLEDRVRSLGMVLLLVMGCRMSAAGILAVVVAERSGTGWAVGAVSALLGAGFLLADVLPRTVALRSLDRVVIGSAIVVSRLAMGLPLRWVVDGLVSIAGRLLPRSLRGDVPVVSEEELSLIHI